MSKQFLLLFVFFVSTPLMAANSRYSKGEGNYIGDITFQSWGTSLRFWTTVSYGKNSFEVFGILNPKDGGFEGKGEMEAVFPGNGKCYAEVLLRVEFEGQGESAVVRQFKLPSYYLGEATLYKGGTLDGLMSCIGVWGKHKTLPNNSRIHLEKAWN